VKLTTKALFAALACTVSASSQAATFMDADWASQFCKAWKRQRHPDQGLGGDAWAKNDAGRGYKTIQIYRDKCGEQGKVELEITNKDARPCAPMAGP